MRDSACSRTNYAKTTRAPRVSRSMIGARVDGPRWGGWHPQHPCPPALDTTAGPFSREFCEVRAPLEFSSSTSRVCQRELPPQRIRTCFKQPPDQPGTPLLAATEPESYFSVHPWPLFSGGGALGEARGSSRPSSRRPFAARERRAGGSTRSGSFLARVENFRSSSLLSCYAARRSSRGAEEAVQAHADAPEAEEENEPIPADPNICNRWEIQDRLPVELLNATHHRSA